MGAELMEKGREGAGRALEDVGIWVQVGKNREGNYMGNWPAGSHKEGRDRTVRGNVKDNFQTGCF